MLSFYTAWKQQKKVWFQGVQKWNIEKKWVNKLLNIPYVCFNPLASDVHLKVTHT